jgi:hypothetical protein
MTNLNTSLAGKTDPNFFPICLQFLNFFVTLVNNGQLQKFMYGVLTMQAKDNNSKFGFTVSAENLNGRMAMIGFIAAVVTELVTGQGVLHFLGIM